VDLMSIVEKVKKRIREEVSGEVDEQIMELKMKFDLILSELKEINRTLKEIRNLLKGDR